MTFFALLPVPSISRSPLRVRFSTLLPSVYVTALLTISTPPPAVALVSVTTSPA
jgi:hypothetical protein